MNWSGITAGGPRFDVAGNHVAQVGPIDVFALGVVEQAIVLAAGTVLLAVVALGLGPELGTRVLETSHRSPIISICIGLPSSIALLSLGYMGLLLADSSLGAFFAIPMMAASAVPFVLFTVIGYVAIGGVLARRLGCDRRWAWVLLGAPLSGLVVLYPPIGLVLLGLAASLGIGAGARVAFNGGGVTNPDERVVPPANEI